MKNSFIKNKIIEFLNSKMFFGIIVYGFLISVMSAINSNDVTIIDSWCFIYTNPYFLALGLFPLIAYIVHESLQNFSKEYMVITRFKNKKEYSSNMLAYVLLVVTISYIALFVCVIVSCNLLNYNGYEIYDFGNYSISNILYFVYLFFKNFFYSMIFVFICVCLCKNGNSKIFTPIILLLCASFILVSYEDVFIQTLENIIILPQSLLVNTTIYQNFKIDFLCNFITILFYLALTVIFLIFILNKKEDIG